jgi:hypothetical protein
MNFFGDPYFVQGVLNATDSNFFATNYYDNGTVVFTGKFLEDNGDKSGPFSFQKTLPAGSNWTEPREKYAEDRSPGWNTLHQDIRLGGLGENHDVNLTGYSYNDTYMFNRTVDDDWISYYYSSNGSDIMFAF